MKTSRRTQSTMGAGGLRGLAALQQSERPSASSCELTCSAVSAVFSPPTAAVLAAIANLLVAIPSAAISAALLSVAAFCNRCMRADGAH